MFTQKIMKNVKKVRMVKMEHLMSIRPLTKKAMKLIGETGYCTTSENYAVEILFIMVKRT